jgi:hypothetical protein
VKHEAEDLIADGIPADVVADLLHDACVIASEMTRNS